MLIDLYKRQTIKKTIKNLSKWRQKKDQGLV